MQTEEDHGHRTTTFPKYHCRLALVTLVLFQQALAWPQVSQQTRRVLVVSELGLGSPGYTAIRQGLVQALQTAPYHTEIYSENLEAVLFSDEASQRQFREWYRIKYRDRKPDVIVALGPAPLQWMNTSDHEVFPDTPVVFWGLSDFDPHPVLDSRFTGVWGGYQPRKTLDAALRLLPETLHVVVVGGSGAFDQLSLGMVKTHLRGYESKVKFTYLTDLAMPDLLEKLRHLPPNTIVLHTSIMEDAAGTRFIDATQSIPQVASAANAPVFVLDEVDLGTGAVGGDLATYSDDGKILGGMTLRVLQGEKLQNIPVVNGSHKNMFDWRALKRWNINERNLPPGSTVLNREPGFWELYWGYVIGTILILGVQAAIIAVLLLERARKKKAQAELVLSNERLRESEDRFELLRTRPPC